VEGDIAERLSFESEIRPETQASQFLRAFVRQVEAIGILVMRNGIVRQATNRSLDVEEFRGFSIADPMAPVVFVNNADSNAAQAFTLAHELAHIWIGRGGISDADPTIKSEDSDDIEEYGVLFDLDEVERWLVEHEKIDRPVPVSTFLWRMTDAMRAEWHVAELEHFVVSGLVYLEACARAAAPKPTIVIDARAQWRAIRELSPAEALRSLLTAAPRIEDDNPGSGRRAGADGIRRRGGPR
jgi:hypothetical protein